MEVKAYEKESVPIESPAAPSTVVAQEKALEEDDDDEDGLC